MKILFSAQPGKGLKPARSKEDIITSFLLVPISMMLVFPTLYLNLFLTDLSSTYSLASFWTLTKDEEDDLSGVSLSGTGGI